METHVGVKGAKLTLAMLQLAPNLKFQLVQYDKPSDRRQDVPRNCDRGAFLAPVTRLVVLNPAGILNWARAAAWPRLTPTCVPDTNTQPH